MLIVGVLSFSLVTKQCSTPETSIKKSYIFHPCDVESRSTLTADQFNLCLGRVAEIKRPIMLLKSWLSLNTINPNPFVHAQKC